MIVSRAEFEAASHSRYGEEGDLRKMQPADSSPEEQFVWLVTSSYRELHRFVLSLVGNVEAADDLTQECCLLLWRKYDEFQTSGDDPRRDFARWARGMAFNLARNFHRLRQPRALAFSDQLLTRLATIQTGADELLELRKAALHNCLKKLSASDREMLQICYGSDSTIDAVAARFKRSPNSLYKVLRRIRRNLFLCINRSLDLE